LFIKPLDKTFPPLIGFLWLGSLFIASPSHSEKKRGLRNPPIWSSEAFSFRIPFFRGLRYAVLPHRPHLIPRAIASLVQNPHAAFVPLKAVSFSLDLVFFLDALYPPLLFCEYVCRSLSCRVNCVPRFPPEKDLIVRAWIFSYFPLRSPIGL